MRRGLYRKLGYSSINQYAKVELKFCKTRTGDFVQLARKLEKLPAVRESVENGVLGYTKAREIVKVATPETEEGWVAAAQDCSRRELERKVAVAKKRARSNPDQAELMPAANDLNVPPAAPPVRLTVEMTSEQFALYEVLLERLHKQGPLGGRAEMLLEAMAELVAARSETADQRPPGGPCGGPSSQVPPSRSTSISARIAARPRSRPARVNWLSGRMLWKERYATARWTSRGNATPPPSRRPSAERSWPAIGTVAGRRGAGIRSFWRCITSGRGQMEAATIWRT
jgi:hypothetical protein